MEKILAIHMTHKRLINRKLNRKMGHVCTQKSNRAGKWKGNKHIEYAPPGSFSRDLKYHLVLVRLSVLLSQKVLSYMSQSKGDSHCLWESRNCYQYVGNNLTTCSQDEGGHTLGFSNSSSAYIPYKTPRSAEGDIYHIGGHVKLAKHWN